jgi:pimeloyl-ACP methyl ester carboxylesterase
MKTLVISLVLMTSATNIRASVAACYTLGQDHLVLAPTQAIHGDQAEGIALLRVEDGALMRADGDRFRLGLNGDGEFVADLTLKDDVLHEDAKALGRVAMTSREIRVPRDGFELAGTLRVPPGPGLHPGIVLIHGSGPQRRAAASFGLLAQRLSCAGFAVLSYDKRGTGESGGHGLRAELPQLSSDVQAAADWLRAQDGIDPNQVGLWGHSQGGWIGPLVASRDAQIAFVIGAGAPAITVWEQNILNLRDWTRRVTGSMAEGAMAEAVARQMYAVAARGEGLDRLRDLEALTKDAPWRDWFKIELRPEELARWRDWGPESHLSKLKTPVLVLIGGQDASVPPMENLYLWQRYLAAAGNDHSMLVEVPGADHGLYIVDGPLNPHGVVESPRQLATVAFDAAADFLSKVTKMTPSPWLN